MVAGGDWIAVGPEESRLASGCPARLLGQPGQPGQLGQTRETHTKRNLRLYGVGRHRSIAAEESIQLLIWQVAGFLQTFAASATMDRLGLQAATRLHGWCSVLFNLLIAYAPSREVGVTCGYRRGGVWNRANRLP